MARYVHKTTNAVDSYRKLETVIYKGKFIPPDGTAEIGDRAILILAGMPAYDSNTQKCTETTPVDFKQTWEVEDLPLASMQANLKREVSQKAKQVADAGIVVNDIPIATTDEAQGRLNRGYAHLGRNPARTVPVPDKEGNWHTMNKAEVDALNDAVGEHIITTWENEKAHHDAIGVADTVVLKAYDTATGWNT